MGVSRVVAMGSRIDKAPITEELDWQMRARCRAGDPNIWFSKTDAGVRAAKKQCAGCPVLVECRMWALRKHEDFGVWGGLSESDRRAIWAGRSLSSRRR